MAYIKKIQISGTTYDIRDNEALHDASAFDTKGSAATAEANAKAYTDDLIKFVNTVSQKASSAMTSAQNAERNAGKTQGELDQLETYVGTFTHDTAKSVVEYIDAKTANIASELDAKVPTSRTINSKALTANVTLSASDVGADASGSASSALANAKTYADTGDSTTLSSAKSYTDTSIANMELITIADIDTICGASIVAASEVTY